MNSPELREPLGQDAASELEIEKIEIVDRYVRYSLIDTNGNKHCVGGRVEGFFDSAEIEAISRLPVQIEDDV
jgi:hypothetical protein